MYLYMLSLIKKKKIFSRNIYKVAINLAVSFGKLHYVKYMISYLRKKSWSEFIFEHQAHIKLKMSEVVKSKK